MANYLNIEILIANYPNIIFQVTGEDLRKFAESLLLNERAIAMQEAEEAARNKLISVEEAAKLLSVSKLTLYRWDKNGILKKVEIGGKRRYRKSDVERLVGFRLP